MLVFYHPKEVIKPSRKQFYLLCETVDKQMKDLFPIVKKQHCFI